MNSRLAFSFWLILLFITSYIFIGQYQKGFVFKTSVLDLLPPTEKDPITEMAVNKFTEKMGSKVMLLVSHPDEKLLPKIASEFENSLMETELLDHLNAKVSDTFLKDIYDFYFPYKESIYTDELFDQLVLKNGFEKLLKQTAKLLYSPMSGLYSKLLEKDPILLFPTFIESLPQSSINIELKNSYMYITDIEGENEIEYILMIADLKGDDFSRDTQVDFGQKINEIELKLNLKYPKTEILKTGMLFFAKEGFEQGEKETRTIGLGSLIGVVLLMLFAFRSFKQLLLGLVSLGFGVYCGFVFSFLIFGELHILTLAFGASLVGVCVDYSFHYFTDNLLVSNREKKESTIKRIFPGVLIGVITSIIGYVSLMIAPFPGLQQMAIFSVFGLLASFISVLCLYPLFINSPKKEFHFFLLSVSNCLLKIMNFRLLQKFKLALYGILSLFAVLGFFLISSNDDIRALNSSSQVLMKVDQKIKRLIGGVDQSRFLLIQDSSIEAVLIKEEKVLDYMSKSIDAFDISKAQSISMFIPSKKKQEEKFLRLKKTLVNQKLLFYDKMEFLGLPSHFSTNYVNEIEQKEIEYLSLDKGIEGTLKDKIGHLWLGEIKETHTKTCFASIVLLPMMKIELAYEKLEDEFSGVSYINKVSDLSSLLTRYRSKIAQLLCFSYIGIAFLLMIKYGIVGGFEISLPPVLSAGITFFIFYLLGIEINIFHMLALLLIMGIGIDYTIFFAESSTASHRTATMYAVLLSAITSILSFGLLALSHAKFLNSFGSTVFVGLFFSLILSPLVQRQKKGKDRMSTI